MSTSRITKPFTHSGEGVEAFGDFLAMTMANIEDGLLRAGLAPGSDYSAIDLLREAMPLAKEQFFNDVIQMSLSEV